MAITQATARKIFLAENTVLKLNVYGNSNIDIFGGILSMIKREEYGDYRHWMTQLWADSAKFKAYLGTNLITFEHLLILIEDDLTKITSNYRKPISPEERLVVTKRLVTLNLFPFLIVLIMCLFGYILSDNIIYVPFSNVYSFLLTDYIFCVLLNNIYHFR